MSRVVVIILLFVSVICLGQNNVLYLNNMVSVDTNGVRLLNNATCFDDLHFDFSRANKGVADYPSFNADSMWYHFTVDTTSPSMCIVYFIGQPSHNWKERTNLQPHVHYHYTVGQGVPTFRLKMKWFNMDEMTGGYKYYILSGNTGTINNSMQLCYLNYLSGAGKKINSIMVMQLYLVSQTGSGGIDAYFFDMHYEIDGLGSSTITSK